MVSEETIRNLHELLNKNSKGAFEHDIINILLENPNLIRETNQYGRTVLATLLDNIDQNTDFELLATNALLLINQGALAGVRSEKSPNLTILHVLASHNQSNTYHGQITLLLKNSQDHDFHFLNGDRENATQYLLKQRNLKPYVQTLMLLANHGVGRDELLKRYLSDDTLAVDHEIGTLLTQENPHSLLELLSNEINKRSTGQIQYKHPWDALKHKVIRIALSNDIFYSSELGKRFMQKLIINNNDKRHDKEIKSLLARAEETKNLNWIQDAALFSLQIFSSQPYIFGHHAIEDTLLLLAEHCVDFVSRPENSLLSLAQYLFNKNTDGKLAGTIDKLIQKSLAAEPLKNNSTLLAKQLLALYPNRHYVVPQELKTSFAQLLASDVSLNLPDFIKVLDRTEITALLQKYPELIRQNDANGYPLLNHRLEMRWLPNSELRITLGELHQWKTWGADLRNRNPTWLFTADYIDEAAIKALANDPEFNLSVTSSSQETLLHHLAKRAQYNGVAALNALVTAGVDINAKDNQGNTALHTFMQNFDHPIPYCRHKELVGWFITNHSQIDQKNLADESPLSLEITLLSKLGCPPGIFQCPWPFETPLVQAYINNKPLFTAIVEMKNYGCNMSNQDTHKAKLVGDLAKELMWDALMYYTKPSSDSDANFKTEFKKKLHRLDSEMSRYRVNWDTIKLNILVALTGIGLLAIAVKLVYSYTQGRALFFGQKATTDGEQKIAAIEALVDGLTV
jgi:hypothetical protein